MSKEIVLLEMRRFPSGAVCRSEPTEKLSARCMQTDEMTISGRTLLTEMLNGEKMLKPFIPPKKHVPSPVLCDDRKLNWLLWSPSSVV